MYAAKLFTILAAALAIADARKGHSKKKGKKEMIKDKVTRNCGAGNATFIVDGFSEEHGKSVVKNCYNDIKLTFALSTDQLRSPRLTKHIKKAAEYGHSLIYRFEPSYDKKFSKLDPAKLVSKLDKVKQTFQDLYGYELTTVFFPYAKHHLTDQVEAVEGAGFRVIGNSVHVGKHFKHTSLHHVKHSLKHLAKKELGAVIHHDADNGHLLEDINKVYGFLHDNKFDIVDLDQCFESLETIEEADVAEAQNAELAKEDKDNGSSAFTYSGAIAAAVAIVAFVV